MPQLALQVFVSKLDEYVQLLVYQTKYGLHDYILCFSKSKEKIKPIE